MVGTHDSVGKRNSNDGKGWKNCLKLAKDAPGDAAINAGEFM